MYITTEAAHEKLTADDAESYLFIANAIYHST